MKPQKRYKKTLLPAQRGTFGFPNVDLRYACTSYNRPLHTQTNIKITSIIKHT